MATTAFWPVYNHLKETIDYAENPDKTIERKYVDEDLYKTLQYAENSDKTDKTMYVSAINCPKQKAYEYMLRTKRRFHESGKIVGYHGYQSFAAGEVTPEEAHQIGIETARRMWGGQYEVVVTTHLNTGHLHTHFCQGLNEHSLYYWKHLQNCSSTIVDFADIWIMYFYLVTI